MSNETLPVIRQASAVIDYNDPKMIKTLKATVAQNATDEEFAMFAGLCQATGLNPFKREVWFIKTKGYTKTDGTEVEGKVQIMTGVNGFHEIANRNPFYDGIELEYGPSVDISLPQNKSGVKSIKAPEWIDAKVYRKDRSRPIAARAIWTECAGELVSKYGKLGIWAQRPTTMLGKCAESMALRKSFPQELNGLYTAEEMPAEYSEPVPDNSGTNMNPAPMPQPVAARLAAPAPQPEKSVYERIKQGTAYEYDIRKLKAEITDESILNELRAKMKDAGATISADKTIAYTIKPVPEMVQFLMNDPAEPPSDFDDDAPDWMDTPEPAVDESTAQEKLAAIKAKRGKK